MNRPRRKRELMEVRTMFEPNRFSEHYLAVAYEQVMPVRRRQTRVTKEKEKSNHEKVARFGGGAL